MVKFMQKSHFDTTHFEDEWIILDTVQYTLTKLNESGGFCWSLLSEPQTLESITEEVVQKFGMQMENVSEDVSAFLQELQECGLIKRVA